VGLAVNAAMGQSCCRFLLLVAPADGARVAGRRSHFTKRSLAAALPDCDRKFERDTPTRRTPFGGGNTDRIKAHL
jgi:hypothetical protein